MTQSIRQLRGDEVLARDGRIGSVHDVYFDQERWAVRYLVVDTGEWLAGKRVLVPPASVETALSSAKKLRLALTRERVERAPPAEDGEPQLRSGAEVIGYGIEARDGAIGEVQDFIIDDKSWTVRDIVVDTLKWWPGGEVRVHPAYVERIDRGERRMHLRLTRDQVKLSGATSARR
jgi:sporulation protein YlmC with PRC-barrel domain